MVPAVSIVMCLPAARSSASSSGMSFASIGFPPVTTTKRVG